MKGRVRHVQSGLEAGFISFAELELFMRQVLTGSVVDRSEPIADSGVPLKEG